MDTALLAALTAISSSGGGIVVLVIILILLGIPYVNKIFNLNKETSAQGMLYQQLSEMVQKQRTELDKLYEDREKEKEENYELRRKVDSLAGYEQQAEVLKRKLDKKDEIIAERDNKITSLLGELMEMKDRVHKLEMRLKEDESKWCDGCQYKNNQYLPPLLGDKNES